MAMSVGREAAPRRGKGWDDASWADMNFTGLKMIKIHAVDSAVTNKQWRFKAIIS
jgi:hypothetical protein